MSVNWTHSSLCVLCVSVLKKATKVFKEQTHSGNPKFPFVLLESIDLGGGLVRR
jgi:hypothetical protein